MDGARKIRTRKRSILIMALFAGVYLFCTHAAADEINNEWYSTTHALSRGNTGISFAGDPSTATWYNPASLGSVRRAGLEFFNPQIEVGKGNFKLTQSIFDVGRYLKLSKMRELHEKRRDEVSSVGFSLYPNFYAKNFALGLLYKVQASSYMDKEGTLFYQSQYLLVPTVALSAGLFNGILKLGFALRGVQVAENNRSTTDFSNIGYDVETREGFGLGIDAGMIITFPWVMLPRIGAVVRNAGGTRFVGSVPLSLVTNSSVTKEKEGQTIDAGFSIRPYVGKRSRLLVAIDWRDVTDYTASRIERKFNLGMELDIARVFQLRVGSSRGYWTAGFGVGGRGGNLSFGTYAEELDPRGYHVKRDRRYTLQFGSRF